MTKKPNSINAMARWSKRTSDQGRVRVRVRIKIRVKAKFRSLSLSLRLSPRLSLSLTLIIPGSRVPRVGLAWHSLEGSE